MCVPQLNCLHRYVLNQPMAVSAYGHLQNFPDDNGVVAALAPKAVVRDRREKAVAL